MKFKQGFTLIEVMIVVVIIAILAAIALPSYQSYVTKSKIKEAQSNLIALSMSAEQVYQRSLSFPSVSLANTAAITAANIFSTWKPSSDAFSFKYESDGSKYTLTAIGLENNLSNCSLILTNEGDRKIVGDCGHGVDWVQ